MSKFLVIEGLEGSGKSSLLQTLKEELGDQIFTTREPGGSPYAEAIRNTTLKNPLAKTAPAETTLCRMFAARFDNTHNNILPALNSGKPAIVDRYDGSSFALNVAAQSDYRLEELFWILRKQLPIVPDKYIFIDVDPVVGLRRAHSRNQSLLAGQPAYDHFDDRDIAFHAKVREGYMRLFKQVPHAIVDANRPLAEVKKTFIGLVKKELGISTSSY